MHTIKGLKNYLISKDGTIYSEFVKRNIITHNDKNGYKVIRLINNGKRKSFFVHRLLALTFIENINNYPCINHIDGNKSNNNLCNLQWCTHKQNMKHAWDNGLYKNNEISIKLANQSTSKIIFDTHENKKYKSISDAARYFNTPFTSFRRLINKSNRFIFI